MAPLTWRNVDAPVFNGANDMWKTAAFLMNQGFDKARQGLSDFREITTDEQSAALMQQVAAAGNDPNKIASITAGANPAFTSPDAIKFANNQPGILLDREGKALANTGEGLLNTQRNQTIRSNEYNFGRTQLDNQRADANYALLPEALSNMETIRAGMSSDDPAVRAKAEQDQTGFLSKYGRSLGITNASELGSYMTGNLNFDEAKRTNTGSRLTFAAGLDETKKNLDAKGMATNLLGLVGNDPDRAIKTLQGLTDVNPELMLATQNQIEAYRKAMPQKTQADSLLEGGTLFNDASRPRITLPTDYKSIVLQNQNSKRSLPPNENLTRVLNSVLPGFGATAIITSGGQSTKAEFATGTATSHGNTGSTRHDHGGASDMQFKAADGHIMSWEDPNDVPVLQGIVTQLKAAGLTGFGAASDYMGPTTTHVGYGTPAVWGAKGGAPYKALLDAYNNSSSTANPPATDYASRGPTVEKAAAAKAAPQYQAAMDAVSNNQAYVAPIDTNRPQVKNDDGTVSTEKTFTTQIGGAWFNIPTIVNGKQLPEQQALAEFKKGTNPAVGVFQSKREAEDRAQERTDNISKMLSDAVTQKDADTTASVQQSNADLTAAVSPTTPSVTPTPTVVTPVAPVASQTVQGQATVPATSAQATTTTNQASTTTQGQAQAQDDTPVGNDTSKEIKVSDRWTIPAVDTNASLAKQDWQNTQRTAAINGSLESIKTNLATEGGGAPLAGAIGSTWDYFMADPNTAKANTASRDASSKALTFYQSDNAKQYFHDNPGALVKAQADPVKFATEFGNTPSQKKVAPTSTDQKSAPPKTADEINSARTRQLNAAETVEQVFAAVNSTQSLDAANDRFPALREAIKAAPENKESVADVANRLTGKEGKLAKYTFENVSDALAKISDELEVKPSVASALLEEKGKYDPGWLWGLFGSGYKLNIKEMKDLYATYQTGANAKPGVSSMVNAELTKYQRTQVSNLEKETTDLQAALKAAIADPNTPPEKVMDYQRRLGQLPDIIKQRVANIVAAGNTDANIRKRTAN